MQADSQSSRQASSNSNGLAERKLWVLIETSAPDRSIPRVQCQPASVPVSPLQRHRHRRPRVSQPLGHAEKPSNIAAARREASLAGRPGAKLIGGRAQRSRSARRRQRREGTQKPMLKASPTHQKINDYTQHPKRRAKQQSLERHFKQDMKN